MVDELMQAQSYLGLAVNWSAASTLLGLSLVVIADLLLPLGR